MPSRHGSRDSLADIIENAERIESYISGKQREEIASAGMLRDAVERCLERICEAAFRLEDQAPTLMPHQPWADVRGMGNRLRHAYDRIDTDVLWNAIRRDLPGLVDDARRALKRLEAGS